MAENMDKEALQAAKEAEKAARKAKQERIKQSKPKKEGTAFSRAGNAVKKFFKDFTGTCKKVVWPTGKQVVKNSLVVLATIIVIGAVVALIDFGLTKIFDLGEQGVVSLAEYVGGDEATTADTALEEAISEGAEAAEAAADETTAEAAEETTAETAEETTESAARVELEAETTA
jgi:preprotein translocase subunit SecE